MHGHVGVDNIRIEYILLPRFQRTIIISQAGRKAWELAFGDRAATQILLRA